MRVGSELAYVCVVGKTEGKESKGTERERCMAVSSAGWQIPVTFKEERHDIAKVFGHACYVVLPIDLPIPS